MVLQKSAWLSILTDRQALFYFLVHLPLLYLVRMMDSLVTCFTQYSLLYGKRSHSEKKCQVVKILWRSSYFPFYLPSLDNYMTIHSDWVDTSLILSAEHVTLLGVNQTHAWFCVTDPAVDVYSSSAGPFVFANQYFLADRLVIVTLDTLHQMADCAGDPTVPVTILDNMGRCGSTMVCKVLSQIPGLRVMSEPWALLNLQYLFMKGGFGLDTYSRLISSVIKIQCKTSQHSALTQILLKLPFPCMAQATLIKTLFPAIRHIYLFRSPTKCILSLIKVWKATPPYFQNCGYLEDFQGTCIPLSHSASHRNFPGLISSGTMSRDQAVAFMILSSLRAARDFVKDCGPFAAVFTYEEIMEKEDEMDRLFGLFGGEVVDKSWKKTDSQENAFLSRENLRRIEAGSFEMTDDMENFFQLPAINSSLFDFKNFINQE